MFMWRYLQAVPKQLYDRVMAKYEEYLGLEFEIFSDTVSVDGLSIMHGHGHAGNYDRRALLRTRRHT